MRLVLVILLHLAAALPALAQANGKLQIQFTDLSQGDGAILIGPNGEMVLFDDAVRNFCDKSLS